MTILSGLVYASCAQPTNRCVADSDCNEGRSCLENVCVSSRGPGGSPGAGGPPACLGDHCDGTLAIMASSGEQRLGAPVIWAMLDRPDRWGFIGFADVTADGRADLVGVERPTDAVTPGTIWVAAGEVGRFAAPQPAGEAWCPDLRSCRLADVDGDQRADLIPVRAVLGAGGAPPQVLLATQATPAAFSEMTRVPQECLSGDVCEAGDVDADGRANLVIFLRGQFGRPGTGRVLVARAATGRFETAQRWHHFFCVEEEDCKVGDVDGDRRADIVAFAKENRPGDKRIQIAFSTGSDFRMEPQATSDVRLCAKGQVCTLADVNGDRWHDFVVFGRGTEGFVWRLKSVGRAAAYLSEVWGRGLCFDGQSCHLADIMGLGFAQPISVPLL